MESLRDRRWCVELCLFENENPKCSVSLIPSRGLLYSIRNIHNIPLVNTKHKFFKNSFFPSTIIEWNNLDPHLRKSENFSSFKSNILKFTRPSPNSVYNCHNPREICLITRLRLDLSHLREYKFKHDFQDTLNPLCSYGSDVDSTEHFLLHNPQFVNERRTLLSTLGNFNCSLLENTSKVSSLEICHSVQVVTPRFLVLQLILFYQLKKLINSLFNNESCIYWPQTRK